MSFPANLSRVWVRGRLVDLGKMASGEVNFGIPKPITFAPSPAVLLNRGTNQIIQTNSFSVMPAGGDGYFAIQLPATNDPDIIPVGWTYAVTEPTGRKYNIVVDINTPTLDSPGDPLHGEQVLDLIDIIPSPGASAGTVQLVGGMVANLGDVMLPNPLPGGSVLMYDSQTGFWRAQTIDFEDQEAGNMRSGPTGSRGAPIRGAQFFDTTLNRPIIGDGANWRDYDGAVLGGTGGGGGSTPGGTSVPAPQNVRNTVDPSARTMNVTWDAIPGGADYYKLYEDRSPDGVAGATNITGTSSLRGPFSADQTNNYWVTAFKGGIESPASNKASGTLGGGSTGSGSGTTPGQILNIGNGTNGKNHFNVGIGYSSGHTDKTPLEIQNGFADSPYFTPARSNTVVQFQVFANGKTTSTNTKYPRSELREMEQNGTDRAAWNGASGTHWMEGKSRITRLPNGRSWVCFTQIHDSRSDLARLQIEGTSSSDLKIVLRNTPPGSDTETVRTVQSSYTIGTELTWRWEVVNGAGKLILNGAQVATFPASISGCYYKTGAYAQFNSTQVAASEWVSVELRDLKHWHTGWPTPADNVGGGGSEEPGGGGSGAQTLGIGGVSTPSGAILTTANSGSTLNITQSGTSSSPRVYDGKGFTVPKINISASYVVVQNFNVSGGNNAGIYSLGTNNTIQNNRITQITSDGDANGITFFGSGTKILFNEIGTDSITLLKGARNGAHLDGIQTWNTPSKMHSADVVIKGNRIVGPDNAETYISQAIMAQGRRATDGGGGGTGESTNWTIEDNYIRIYRGNQTTKMDDVNNVTYRRNTFAGSNNKIVAKGSFSTGITFVTSGADANIVTGTYTSYVGD